MCTVGKNNLYKDEDCSSRARRRREKAERPGGAYAELVEGRQLNELEA